MLVSIIIPIYNIENYIRKCVDSILTQEFSELAEIILVDDGSKDGSAKIVDEYAEKYANVIACHKENGGLSDARNAGVKYATGKYILFLDGDDYLHQEALKYIKQAAERNNYPDVILQESNYSDNCGEISLPERFHAREVECVSGLEMLKYTSAISLNWCAWGKCFKREFWLAGQYEFVKGRLCEDMQLIDKVVAAAGSACMMPAIVHYCYREDSIYHKVSYNFMHSILLNISEWQEYFSEHPEIDEELKAQILCWHGSSYVDNVLAYIWQVSKKDQKKLLVEAKEYKNYIYYWSTDKGLKLQKLYKLVGFRLFVYILGKRKSYWISKERNH